MGVGNHQLNTMEASFDESLEEALPVQCGLAPGHVYPYNL